MNYQIKKFLGNTVFTEGSWHEVMDSNPVKSRYGIDKLKYISDWTVHDGSFNDLCEWYRGWGFVDPFKDCKKDNG